MLRRRGLIEQDFLERVATRFLVAGTRHGHVVHRRYRGGLRSTVNYLRWCDGHGAVGLVDAAAALTSASDHG